MKAVEKKFLWVLLIMLFKEVVRLEFVEETLKESFKRKPSSSTFIIHVTIMILFASML